MPERSQSFTTKNVLVCDEIRREDTGKFIIIGVYNDNIRVPHFPVDTALAFFISAIPHKEGEISCRWRLQHNKAGPLTMSDGKIIFSEIEKEVFFILRRVPVQLPEEGNLSLQIKEHGKRWRTLKSIPVTLQSADS